MNKEYVMLLLSTTLAISGCNSTKEHTKQGSANPPSSKIGILPKPLEPKPLEPQTQKPTEPSNQPMDITLTLPEGSIPIISPEVCIHDSSRLQKCAAEILDVSGFSKDVEPKLYYISKFKTVVEGDCSKFPMPLVLTITLDGDERTQSTFDIMMYLNKEFRIYHQNAVDRLQIQDLRDDSIKIAADYPQNCRIGIVPTLNKDAEQ